MSSQPEVLGTELLDAFVRLAQGDFSARVARNYKRDASDTLAYFFNLLAEELGRVLPEKEAMRQRLETGVAELSEAFLRFAAGDFEVSAKRNGSGDPLDVLGYLFDNTVAEVRDTVSELDRQRATMNAIFDAIGDGVFLLDSAAVVRRANRAAGSLLNRTISELEGADFASLLGARDLEFGEALAKGIVRESDSRRDVYFEIAGGQPVAYVVSVAQVLGAEGEVGGIVVTMRDDRSLRRAQAQLQLADRMATMGTLAAGVAHEINNPLSYVLSNLEYLEEELENLRPGEPLPAALHQEMFRALATSREGALRVSQIVRDLKSMSRVEEETIATVDLARVLDSASNMLRNDIRHRARLVKAYGDTPPVLANEARLLQVALNLIQNAAHAIPVGDVANNQIFLETRAGTDGEASFSVTDTGGGIAPADLEAIFENFYTTKPIGQGTGLGLSICRRIVEQAGGRIEVSSEPGRGTTFRVCLPAAKIHRDVKAATAAAAPALAVRRRVLVIDDERAIGESIKRLLGSAHRVDVTVDGKEALERFAEMPYDLVLIDLMMPEMPGSAVREALETRFPDHRALVVMMSGGNLDDAHDRPGDLFVEKPVSRAILDDLLSKIAQLR